MTLEPFSNISCFNGAIVDDEIGLEGTEGFTVSIRDPAVSGIEIGNDATVVNIVDDDGNFTH